MLNIILSGAPGCGKGTQSYLIAQKYNLVHFSTGDLLRKEMSSHSELGIKAESYITAGNLVPDDMIVNILMNAIDNFLQHSEGMILDGFPRTLTQAEILDKMLKERNMLINAMLDIDVETNELVNRLILRGQTSGRTDDNHEIVQKRLEVYHEKTAPVSNYYKISNKYFKINGMGTIEEIFDRISIVLDSFKQ